MMTKSQYSEVGKCGHQAEPGSAGPIGSLVRQCRGVRPDREQEVRGDSSQPVADNVSVPINTRHAVARAESGEVAADIVSAAFISV